MYVATRSRINKIMDLIRHEKESFALELEQEGPVSLHWLIREIHSYQTLHYLGIGLKHKTPYKD